MAPSPKTRGKQRYVTDSKCVFVSGIKRNDDPEMNERKDSVGAKWTVANEDENTNLCGSVRVGFVDGKAVVYDDLKPDGVVRDFEQISSALALYRAISLFHCGVRCKADYYKLNWMIVLKHNKTGKHLGLGEWKGGFQIFTDGTSPKKAKAFVADVAELLTLLVDPKLTIGYDGVVAGSVA